ncbi:hypothetical protein Esti_002964 [Eimeria stiedai]
MRIFMAKRTASSKFLRSPRRRGFLTDPPGVTPWAPHLISGWRAAKNIPLIMATSPPLPSQIRLLLLADRTPRQHGATKPRQWPCLKPLTFPYPSCSTAMVDFFVDGQTVYEINRSCRSVGVCSALLPPQLVISDASLLLASPVDPLLLLLPQLKQLAAASYLPLLEAVAPQNLEVEVRKNLHALATQPGVLRRLHYLCDLQNLSSVADFTAATKSSADSGTAAAQTSEGAEATDRPVSAEEGVARGAAVANGSLFVRFNPKKTLDFLIKKHKKLAAVVAHRSTACLASSNGEKLGAVSAATPPPDKNAHSLALSIFSAYLPKATAAALEQRLRKEGWLLSEEKPPAAASASKSEEEISLGTSCNNCETLAPPKKAAVEKTGTRVKRTATASSSASRKTPAKRRT